MSDRNNDKIKSLIKGRLGDYSHPVSDDLWPLIERQLQMRMRRNRVKRMISMVAGVAAVILVAILLMIPEKKDVIAPLSSPIANYNAGVEIAQKRKPLISHAEESVNHGEMRGKKHGEKKIESIRTPQQDSAVSSKEQQPTTTREVSKSENRAKKTESENARGLNQATPTTNSWSDDIPIRRKRKNLSLTLAFNEIGKNSQSTDKYRIHGGDIGSSYKIVNRNSRFNLPVNVGVLVSIGINKRLSAESGLSYTYLSSRETVKTDDILTEESSLKLHYLGIPLKVAYVIYRNNILSLYGSAGIMGEKLLSGTRTITYPVAKSNNITIPPIQWSASAALGVDFKLGKRWGIYCEPGISYYFDDGSDIYTVRKERPLTFNLQAGLRFSIR